jgi:hypothetical protein
MRFFTGLRNVLRSAGGSASRVLERVGTVLAIVGSGTKGGRSADPEAQSMYLPPKDEYRP